MALADRGSQHHPCGWPGHHCDLHRQQELLEHYTHARVIPTIVWDKDRQLPAADRLRGLDHIMVCEAALNPTPGATSLLFPVDDTVLDAADPAELVTRDRDLPLVYIGNQYDRDAAFGEFFAPAAAHFRHAVVGSGLAPTHGPT